MPILRITCRLRNDLEPVLGAVAGVRSLYLFGSALSTESPRDIDLVLVYGAPLTPLSVRGLAEPIGEIVERALGVPAHVLFFTEREAAEPGFSNFRPKLVIAFHTA